LRRQLQAQFAQAQGALVEVFAQRLKKCPVFGKGAQDALGFGRPLENKNADCTASGRRDFTCR
jgi:hypothetical protein